MTEKEKLQAGLPYDANFDPELLALRSACAEMLHDFNLLRPSQTAERDALSRKILGSAGTEISITSPFFCDYGYNISIGNQVFINTGCVILDEAGVTIGNHVFIGPGCGIFTASHPLDPRQRALGIETAKPVVIENDVWIGGNVTILPGVTIGHGAVIGAGSVVTSSIPPLHVAYGNPCRPQRPI